MKFVMTLGDAVELVLVAGIVTGLFVGTVLVVGTVVEWARGVKRKNGGR